MQGYTDPIVLWDSEFSIAYLSLARMAYDMMSILASSTSIERLFSLGRIIVTKRHNRLGPDAIYNLMCINKWLPDFGKDVIHAYADDN